jgi:hypothetical protein
MANPVKGSGPKYVRAKVVEVGYSDETKVEGVLVLKSEDGGTFFMGSFSGEVSLHISRFLTGDRSSIPTIYQMLSELADYEGLSLEKVEIYGRSGVLRANLYFVGRDKEVRLTNYRASDAIALATFYGTPIFVDKNLFIYDVDL